MVDLNGPVVHLGDGLHLYVVAVALVQPLAVDVVVEILVGNVLGEIVRILQLSKGGKSNTSLLIIYPSYTQSTIKTGTPSGLVLNGLGVTDSY